MPKYKERRAGDDLRIFKGKYCRNVNADIQDEFEDDIDDEEICDLKPEDVSEPVDSRSYDEILLEAFEKGNEKSSKIRVEALVAISGQLERYHIPKFLKKHFSLIIKIIECGFERNVGVEVKLIAQIVALCYVQLSKEKKFIEKFRPIVQTASENQTFNVAVRSDLCKILAVLIFLHKNSSKILFNTMSRFEEILTEKTFVRANYNRASTSSTATQIEDIEFLIAILDAWTFLYTLLDSDAKPIGDGFARNLVTLLKCTSYDLRIACAKTISVIYGCGNNDSREYVECNLLKIIDDITMMRNNVYQFKYDGKTKDIILYYLKNGSIPRREIKIGNKVLVLDTWSLNVQYDMLSDIFGAGNIPKILQENVFLFNLLKGLQSPEDQTSHESAVSNARVSIEKNVQLSADPIDWGIVKIKDSIEKAASNFSINLDDELRSFCTEFQSGRVSSSVLIPNKENILQIFILVMKRNIESEKMIVIEFATQVIVSLGDKNQFSQKIREEMLMELRDPNISTSIISNICTALSFIVYLKNESLHTVLLLMRHCKNIFTGSFPKNRKSSSMSDDTEAMQCNALEGWGIMLTVLPPEEIRSLLDNLGRDSVNKHLDALLQSEQKEVRIVTGEVICLIIEHLRELHLNLHINSQVLKYAAIMSKYLKDSSSSRKFRSQHARFNKVLIYLQNGVAPKYNLKVGKEQHELNSWSACLKYKKLSEIMGTGLNTHLSENDRLRKIVPIDEKTLKIKK